MGEVYLNIVIWIMAGITFYGVLVLLYVMATLWVEYRQEKQEKEAESLNRLTDDSDFYHLD